MKRWEYKNDEFDSQPISGELSVRLNNLGQHGWEMVGFSKISPKLFSNDRWLIIFKRELRN